jgi:hypothetical protein
MILGFFFSKYLQNLCNWLNRHDLLKKLKKPEYKKFGFYAKFWL